MRRNRGYTLIENIIALTIGAGVVAAAGALVSTSLKVNSRMLQTSRLNEELGNIVSLITSDIQRAGYSGAASIRLTTDPAAVMPFNQPVKVSEFNGEQSDSCIVFTYDRNRNGQLNSAAPNEYFGYRLRDNSIEIRLDGAACDEPGWEDLTDNDIVKVTELRFSLAVMRANRLSWQTVVLHIAGELVSDQRYQRRYTERVRIANAYY
ncbi:MAG: prepilin-type N-terminal cleavage/methylation domain-containing protein [Alteromonadaceae bacterium]|nr:prepilin-type N-terminal cleavage/methylation domain-containing protein [Alteromonadaceae bacterium]